VKVAVLTLGCRVNQSESSQIEGCLRNQGFSVVSLSGNPDYCIINTCTVTAKSDYQSRQLIRRAVRSGAQVIVTGCYSQLRPEEILKIDTRIRIVKNADKLQDIKALFKIISGSDLSYSSRSRPLVKVQDGCNYSCSYCIVHRARGKSRSVAPHDIIRQIQTYAETGYKEVVLTGIHLGSYGQDLDPQLALSQLLSNILKDTNIHRIRLSSIEVGEVDDELIDLLRSERICRHIHLPLQSGDENILRLMNRTYTSRAYLSTVEKIFYHLPDICLGADVIVGFPGEGKDEFARTKAMLDSIPISYMHIFPYSPRPGTPASVMTGQIDEIEKKRRFAELDDLNGKKRKAYISSQIGRVLEVVVEERQRPDLCLGTSGNYLKVEIAAEGIPGKTCLNIGVTGADGYRLRGTPIDEL
jgi:threonylcarbamoyladenosine tRNA methylthiotransferase MtaB